MPRTITVALSEAAIKKHAADSEIKELRDPSRPIRFRYHTGRQRGSYYLIKHAGGKRQWHKIGNYPDLPVKNFLAVLPDVCSRLAIRPDGSTVANTGWLTVGEVLAWHAQRVTSDRNLSDSRKATSRSALKRQLIPCLGALPLAQLNRATLDEKLMWPLQSKYSLAHVRLVFGVLKVAIKQAASLGLIGSNPLVDVTFTNFIKTKIKPKEARLRPNDVGRLLGIWAERYDSNAASVAMAVLMLTHGTRLGETRQAKWQHFDLVDNTWHIPAANTKTKCAHTLPLTEQLRAFLCRYRQTQTVAGYEGAYLFPGAQGQPLGERPAQSSFTSLSDDEWTSHDLRKTARTAWTDLGIDYLIGELLLNHALKSLDVTYIHTTAETQKRNALERWHTWLDGRGFAALHSPIETSEAKV